MRGVMTEAAVPTYGLFGQDQSFADVLHCERVSARAPLYDWSIALHRHAGIWQMLAVFDGGGELAAGDARLAFGAKSAILVPAGLIHGFRFRAGTRGLVVSLPASADLTADILPDRALIVPLDAVLEANFRELESEFMGQSAGRATMLGALARLVSTRIMRAAAGQSAGQRDSTHALFQRFNDLIDRHMSEPLAVAEYADRLAISPTHLSRVCRAACGVSARAVIRERRMAEARALLAHTDIRVSAVGYSVGFADPNHFSRIFRDHCGVSPKSFRQNTRREA